MADRTSLLTIPAELQLAICRQLLAMGAERGPGDTRAKIAGKTWESALEHFPALGNLALTCKHFQRLVAPLLYQSVKIAIDEPSVFIRLIMRFSRSPDDATLVRDVDISADCDSCALSPNKAAFLCREASRLGVRRPASETDVSGSVDTASLLIDVLLCQVSNVQKLIIREPETVAWGRRVPIGLEYAMRLPDNLVFESLQHLEALPPERLAMSRGHMSSLAAILRRTPVLTHLCIGRRDRYYTESILRQTMPHLRELRVADVSPETLEDLIRCCPRLERVHFAADTFDLSPMAAKFQAYHESLHPDQVKPGPLYHALKILLPLSSTLRALSIQWESNIAVRLQDLDVLSGFGALQSLELRFAKWPSGDPRGLIAKLPRGIQSLHVEGRCLPIHDIALTLAEQVRDGRLSELKCFRYAQSRLPWEETKESEAGEKVALLFEGTDVDCAEATPHDFS